MCESAFRITEIYLRRENDRLANVNAESVCAGDERGIWKRQNNKTVHQKQLWTAL